MTANPLRPVQDRIVALDVLRGFALFGVLLVNMLDFSGSALRAGTLGLRGTPIDQIVDIGIVLFAIAKFYLLFSFLFGVGFAVQMRRMEASGRPFIGFYLRRLIILLVIGSLHASFIWDGDILRLYALAGLLLLLVRKFPTRLLIGMALVIALAGLLYFSSVPDIAQTSTSMASDNIAVYSNGSYTDLVSHRLAGLEATFDIQIPMVLVMFLLGLAVGRSGILDQADRYRPFLRRWWLPALIIGLLGNGLMLVGFSDGSSWLVSLGIHVGAPALSLFYIAVVLLNVERLAWLAPVGQMALSNYLSQSIICTTLFYGYGVGLYDQLSPAVTLGLVVLIYSIQLVFSTWWMQHFRFGVMEWLWRSLTYGQLHSIRRTKSANTAS